MCQIGEFASSVYSKRMYVPFRDRVYTWQMFRQCLNSWADKAKLIFIYMSKYHSSQICLHGLLQPSFYHYYDNYGLSFSSIYLVLYLSVYQSI